MSWASPYANAAGQAVVNRARFAVSAMRRPFLTQAAIAALISGVRASLEQFRIPTQAFSL